MHKESLESFLMVVRTSDGTKDSKPEQTQGVEHEQDAQGNSNSDECGHLYYKLVKFETGRDGRVVRYGAILTFGGR
jgi:hypothetical protein